MPTEKQWGEIHPDKKGWTRKPGAKEQNWSYKTADFSFVEVKEPTLELMSEKEFEEFCRKRRLMAKDPSLVVC